MPLVLTKIASKRISLTWFYDHDGTIIHRDFIRNRVWRVIVTGASPASRDRGGKIKIRGQRFSPKCDRRLFLAEITNFPTKCRRSPKKKRNKKGLRRNPKAFSGRNHKKRSSPKSEGFLWPKSQILTFLCPKTPTSSSQKNTVGGKKKIGGKTKIGGRALPPRWRRA